MKLRIYTDGACKNNPGAGGWGCVIAREEKLDIICGGKKHTTNNEMELEAVINAIRIALKAKESEIEIISDSAYVINGINNCWIAKWVLNGWKNSKGDPIKNKEKWKEILVIMADKEYKKKKVKFTKVKGHNGNPLNEMADGIASKEAERRR